MRLRVKILMIAGALITARLGAAASRRRDGFDGSNPQMAQTRWQ
jgi:hypothetical protein